MCQAKDIWLVISQDWASIIGSILSPFKWVFIDGAKDLPTPSYFTTPPNKQQEM